MGMGIMALLPLGEAFVQQLTSSMTMMIMMMKGIHLSQKTWKKQTRACLQKEGQCELIFSLKLRREYTKNTETPNYHSSQSNNTKTKMFASKLRELNISGHKLQYIFVVTNIKVCGGTLNVGIAVWSVANGPN